MVVDAHTHVFSLDTRRYPLADPGAAYRPAADGSAAQLQRQMEEAGVDRGLAITPGFYGWDNRYSLEALEGNRAWLAVGVLVDPLSPQAPAELERCVRQGACGLRLQRHLFYHGAFDDPAITPLWVRAADLGIAVDVNATHEEYGQVERRIREFSGLPVVLDHCGYISPGLAPRQPTVAPVLRLARYPNVYAKLTFAALASRQEYPFADVHWMVRQVVDAFGPERCLYGSNFPTAQYSPGMDYRQSLALFAEVLDLSALERGWILGGTALKLWQWEAGTPRRAATPR